ncbi:MAG: hypothetical protein ACFE9L_03425 [Candidatus Hodarchaeota archaeon]
MNPPASHLWLSTRNQGIQEYRIPAGRPGFKRHKRGVYSLKIPVGALFFNEKLP